MNVTETIEVGDTVRIGEGQVDWVVATLYSRRTPWGQVPSAALKSGLTNRTRYHEPVRNLRLYKKTSRA